MAKNPNAKVPMIEEPETKFTLTESSAILMHLAERKKRLLPESGPARWDVIRWLFFQASSVGPTLGEAAHYSFLAPEKIPYAIQRYGKEWERIAGLLEKQLASKPFLVDELTIADLAHFGWLEFVRNRGMDTKAWPSVTAWLDRIAGRPGVQEGVNRLKALEPKMR
jgi:GST-like protein